MDESITIYKKQYIEPELFVTAVRLTDVILASDIEQYKETVFDGGDWGDSYDDLLAGS